MTFSKKNLFIYIMLLIILVAILYVLTYGVEGEETPPLREVSVILRSRTDENWVALKQGIDQASLEFNVDVSYIMLSEENNAQEQKTLISREVQNGVSGIIINCSDSEELCDILNEVSIKIPIITVDSPVNEADRNILHISADDESMAKALSEEILKDGLSGKKIAIINGAVKCENVDIRIKSLTELLSSESINCDIFSLKSDLSDVNEITDNLISDHYDVVISPDVATLEKVAANFDSRGKSTIELYGFGATGPIASYIEKGIINAVVVQNDFAVGYLCINRFAKTNGKADYPEIGFEVVNAKNLYEGNIQKLMFPYIR